MGEAKRRAAHSQARRQMNGLKFKADHDGAMRQMVESSFWGIRERLSGGGGI